MGIKRALDVTVAGLGLLALLPLFALLALVVRCSSEGPIFYRWEVVGQGGAPFRGYKFRTMFKNADALKAQLWARNEMMGPVFKMANDPRITPAGRWMRRLSLDELPQLWSVFTGRMSLVGPRPPLQSEYEHFSPQQRAKLQVRPGLTCLWQVRGRNRIRDLDEWVRLDLEYIRNWSLRLDFRILLATIPIVILGQGR
ncbi:MAG: sugar transferase [Terriglobales bacterium]